MAKSSSLPLDDAVDDHRAQQYGNTGQKPLPDGLMLAIEFVKNRKSKEPAPEAALAIFEETRRNGLVASRSGPYRNVIRMCPPLCLAMSDLDAVMERFERSFKAVTG